MLDICICTHNPRRDVIRKAVEAIAAQVFERSLFRVLVVDNRSNPPLDADVLTPLVEAGIDARIVVEDAPGIARARLRAMSETDAPWVLFVDDDNELAPDYLEVGSRFLNANPKAGCFGGKLILAPDLSPPSWVTPFLPYLGIVDHGEQEIIATEDRWGPWEPPTAGAWVRREVLGRYVERANDPRVFSLGRNGVTGLASCEDSLIMRGAASLGFSSAYVPSLRLWHHLEPRRFEYRYLLPLMIGYGRSVVLLEHLIGSTREVRDVYANASGFEALLGSILDNRDLLPRFRAALIGWHIAGRRTFLELES